jgi:glucose-1-phosphate cytidylyltransferase
MSQQKPQVVILAGGFGTRIKEYPDAIPKPMVPIGGRPILWHVMKSYSHYGFNDFVICLGYRSEAIRSYFLNFPTLNNDVTLRLSGSETHVEKNYGKDDLLWKVTLVDTGLNTLTGGRIKRIKDHLATDNFFISYGDTLCDIDFAKQLEFHKNHGGEVTISGVNQYSRFGHIIMDEKNQVNSFREKPLLSEVVSGGFFVANRKFVDRIDNDNTQLESEPLQSASKEKQLYCFYHQGFWSCMDTYRDYEYLNGLYASHECPWVKWGY